MLRRNPERYRSSRRWRIPSRASGRFILLRAPGAVSSASFLLVRSDAANKEIATQKDSSVASRVRSLLQEMHPLDRVNDHFRLRTLLRVEHRVAGIFQFYTQTRREHVCDRLSTSDSISNRATLISCQFAMRIRAMIVSGIGVIMPLKFFVHASKLS